MLFVLTNNCRSSENIYAWINTRAHADAFSCERVCALRFRAVHECHRWAASERTQCCRCDLLGGKNSDGPPSASACSCAETFVLSADQQLRPARNVVCKSPRYGVNAHGGGGRLGLETSRWKRVCSALNYTVRTAELVEFLFADWRYVRHAGGLFHSAPGRL